jgi:hypothetical protein
LWYRLALPVPIQPLVPIKRPITFSPCSAIAAPTLADVRVWVESDPNPSRRELASYFAVC